ncbi:3-hydroxybutyryl-CoA dehydratase [Ochrobactrum daejeonense]|uniref:3-hydroxybutyryl-CoA dehydratase n=1 Tax=Brucella daejeonensis TaxID=659015 RepID=A0A7W9EP96_9HYPH|nr:MaoC family dehydratase [Brucella daejeonensis]MBB5703935.1 3-hydroxybutyryl-CoA dehydratase [Brucella daejeonensis]NKB79947.1 MaoC family dehydratase [Brucella daejeonensis]
MTDMRISGYYFEDLTVGMTASLTKAISQEDINLFATVTGDRNPVHIDEDWAQTTRFKGRIAHGVLTAGLISAVMGTRLPGPGNIYLKQTLEFQAPVKPGDVVTATVTIRELIPERRRVILDTVCACGPTTVLTGEALLSVQTREKPL